MDKFRTEGIIVNALTYQDYDRIISVFTPEEGLIKFFFKGAISTKKGGPATTSPLTVVELIYTKGKSELLPCREISILNPHLALRQNLPTLQAACELLHIINVTQLPGKPSPDLYHLLLTFLNKLPTAHDPATLSASFRLKTLRHEGLWRDYTKCDLCHHELEDCFIMHNEVFCHRHSPPHALQLSPSERDILQLLGFSRDLPLLTSLPMTESLSSKIRQLFDDSLERT